MVFCSDLIGPILVNAFFCPFPFHYIVMFAFLMCAHAQPPSSSSSWIYKSTVETKQVIMQLSLCEVNDSCQVKQTRPFFCHPGGYMFIQQNNAEANFPGEFAPCLLRLLTVSERIRKQGFKTFLQMYCGDAEI